MNELFTVRPDLTCYAKMAANKVGYIAGQMELTSDCSQRCAFCDSWRSHVKGTIRGTLSVFTINEILTQLNLMPTFEHLSFTGGEPQDWKDPADPDFGFEQLLRIIALQNLKFSLQVNTTLIHHMDANLWRRVLSRVRVSLDGIKRETYKRLRGDDRDPEEIIARMEFLAHPGLATMTCVSDGNIDEVPAIIKRLNKMQTPPRKAMFLAVLGADVKPGFWEKYKELKKVESPNVQTSFQEDVVAVRAFCDSIEAERIPCYAGGITFHIKCNGDVYPCCLVGGEAIKTQEHMKLGNITQGDTTLASIHKKYKALCFYHKGSPCSQVCQWKQLHVNRIAHTSKKVTLTMP